MKSKTLSWDNNLSIRNAISLLKDGKVIIAPSDTVIGLYAIPSEKGFSSLNAIKKRTDKPYLLLLSSLKEIYGYVERLDVIQIEKIIHACWPGPLTIIFKARRDVPAYLVSAEHTIAIRIPADEKVQALLKETGPLFSTSANLSGEPVPVTFRDLSQELKERVDAVVEADLIQTHIPSTIINTTVRPVTIVREGAYSEKEIKRLLD
jgi:L-threonylcarbamoyladenylate synthase